MCFYMEHWPVCINSEPCTLWGLCTRGSREENWSFMIEVFPFSLGHGPSSSPS
uniref:Uncharacterized protein n=1 Tax=Anguilla anguilla TaxID=7936 RepID=A0A0E9R290_ANGAN